MKRVALLLVTALFLGSTPRALAQLPANATVYASGLNGPRGLQFGPDGYLYVAEAGTGGATQTVGSCEQVPAPVGPYSGGPTGRISKIDRSGTRITVASGFPSAVSSLPTGDTQGVAGVTFLDGWLYALTAGGGCSHGNTALPNGIYRVDVRSGNWQLIANLSAFLVSHPAKYQSAGDFEPDGAFYSLIAADGKLLAVEANHGQIFSVEPRGQIQELIDISASEGHIVPTSIAERDGLLYVGNLGLFPVLPQWQRILTIGRSPLSFFAPGVVYGKERMRRHIVDSVAGLTTVVGVAFGPDGMLYALELSSGAGNPAPGLGKVVRVTPAGEVQDVVTGLAVPTGMTFGPDGYLYVSNLGAVPGNAGQILRIDISGAM